MSRSSLDLDLSGNAKQSLAFKSTAREILYGGAAGGGKSHLNRVLAIYYCAQIPGLQVYLFRRKAKDLKQNHVDGPTGFRAMLQCWVDTGFCTIVEEEVRFWNGSKIHLCHCQHEKDRFNYQGAEIHMLLIEEATQFTELIIRFLRSRCRVPDALKIPDELKGLFPRIYLTSNPGGPGHDYLKRTFIDARPAFIIEQVPDSEGGFTRQFIPAKLDDNPYINREEYKQALSGLGSPAYVRAMLEGDWSAVVGAFYTEFSEDMHVIEPFSIPKHWTRFCALDWGSADPFSVGWYAVSDGTMGRFARGTLIKYREWYGGEDGRGFKLYVEQIADGILLREVGEGDIQYRVAGHDLFEQRGGPSLAERLAMKGVIFRRADNSRVPGWDEIRRRLVGKDGIPALYFFSTCRDTIRTIPLAQHSESDGNDLMLLDDHCLDETRYACMSRPWETDIKEVEPIRGIEAMTLNRLIKMEQRGSRHR